LVQGGAGGSTIGGGVGGVPDGLRGGVGGVAGLVMVIGGSGLCGQLQSSPDEPDPPAANAEQTPPSNAMALTTAILRSRFEENVEEVSMSLQRRPEGKGARSSVVCAARVSSSGVRHAASLTCTHGKKIIRIGLGSGGQLGEVGTVEAEHRSAAKTACTNTAARPTWATTAPGMTARGVDGVAAKTIRSSVRTAIGAPCDRTTWGGGMGSWVFQSRP
jgi:hypothetical protein